MTTISDELRQAAQRIREGAECDPILVADWLECETGRAEQMADGPYGSAGVEFVYGAGDPHPALLLARRINGGAS